MDALDDARAALTQALLRDAHPDLRSLLNESRDATSDALDGVHAYLRALGQR